MRPWKREKTLCEGPKFSLDKRNVIRDCFLWDIIVSDNSYNFTLGKCYLTADDAAFVALPFRHESGATSD